MASNPTEAEHARRTEIRLARDFLQSNLPQEVSLGALPSSWSEVEDSIDDREATDTADNVSSNAPGESQISISDSAFAASFSSQTHELENDQARDEAESMQNRRAAYLAARADSFDAWRSVSLVSARDNHTEEEIEL